MSIPCCRTVPYPCVHFSSDAISAMLTASRALRDITDRFSPDSPFVIACQQAVTRDGFYDNISTIRSYTDALPQGYRVVLVYNDGRFYFDSSLPNSLHDGVHVWKTMALKTFQVNGQGDQSFTAIENHNTRPEIVIAQVNGANGVFQTVPYCDKRMACNYKKHVIGYDVRISSTDGSAEAYAAWVPDQNADVTTTIRMSVPFDM